MYRINNLKETAIYDERQFSSIINEIIKLFALNNISIEEADKVLYKTKEQLFKQKVVLSSSKNNIVQNDHVSSNSLAHAICEDFSSKLLEDLINH